MEERRVLDVEAVAKQLEASKIFRGKCHFHCCGNIYNTRLDLFDHFDKAHPEEYKELRKILNLRFMEQTSTLDKEQLGPMKRPKQPRCNKAKNRSVKKKRSVWVIYHHNGPNR